MRGPLVGLGLALSGCVASPHTAAGFVDPGAGQSRGTVGGDVRAGGFSGSGVGAGGTLRVAPRVSSRWSVPLEAGTQVGVSEDALSFGTLRAGARVQLDSGALFGGGLVGQAVFRSGRWGAGGGADIELGYAHAWPRWAVSAVARPGVSATSLTVATLWVPSEVALAFRVRPHLSLYGAASVSVGVAFAGPFGLLVTGGGMSAGISGRWGVR